MAITVSGRESKTNVYTGANELVKSRRQKYNSQLRSMQQITSAPGNPKPLEYIFMYPPQSFTHEGYGVNLNQIPRPYLAPIVDPTAGNARKASFEFNVMAQLDLFKDGVYVDTVGDGFQFSTDDEIAIIQTFADNAVPVIFNNVHLQLAEVKWYIESVTFTHNRSVLSGSTTVSTCNISLTEYTTFDRKLILLPRFKYGNITQTAKKDISKVTPPPDDQGEYDKRIREQQNIPIGNGSSAQAGING